MIYAILMTVVLSASPSTGVFDYDTGMKLASANNKPVAVFVGDWADNMLDAQAKAFIGDKVILVRVEQGSPIASALQIDKGFVISTAGGSQQVFSCSVPLSKAELAKALMKYADPNFKFIRTETFPQPVKRIVLPAKGGT